MSTLRPLNLSDARAAVPFMLAVLFFIFPFDQAIKFSNLFGFELPIRLSQLLALVIIGRYLFFSSLKVKLWSWIGTLFLAYVALNVYSLTYVPNFDFASRQLLVLLSWPVMYLAVLLALKNVEQVPGILKIMIWSAYISLGFSIIQVLVYWLTGITLGILPEGTGDHLRGRAYGFYLEPNWFGVYQVTILPLMVWAYRNPERVGIKKGIQFLGLLMFAASFLLSQNRGALIAVAVQAVFYMLFFHNKKSADTTEADTRRRLVLNSLIVLSGLGAICVFMLLAPGELQGSIVTRLFDNIVSTEESASSGRLLAYKVMWDAFLASPIHGHGLASWATLVQGWRIVDDNLVQANVTAANEYLRVLAEDGLVGFTLVMGMLVLMFKKLTRARRVEGTVLPGLMVAFLVSFVGFLSAGNFYGVRGMVNALPVFGLYIATANLLVRDEQERSEAALSDMRPTLEVPHHAG